MAPQNGESSVHETTEEPHASMDSVILHGFPDGHPMAAYHTDEMDGVKVTMMPLISESKSAECSEVEWGSDSEHEFVDVESHESKVGWWTDDSVDSDRVHIDVQLGGNRSA